MHVITSIVRAGRATDLTPRTPISRARPQTSPPTRHGRLRREHAPRTRQVVQAALLVSTMVGCMACDNPCGQLASTDPSQDRYMEALEGVAQLVGAPASMVTILAPGQDQPWIGASGCMDLEAQTPMTLDGSMRFASVSKLLNALVFMSIVEGGDVSLDDAITINAPGYDQAPTARDLLMMTSGVPDYLTDSFWQDINQDMQRVRTRDDLMAYGLAEPPEGRPGERWRYSNTNHLLLEAHLEARTGRSLQEHLETLHQGKAPSLVYTHLSDPRGTFTGSASQVCSRTLCRVEDLEDTYHPSFLAAAGSLAGKPAELASLTRTLLHDGGLSESSLGALTQWRAVEGEDYKQVGAEHGLGLFNLATSSRPWWGHPGLGVGDSSMVAYEPESGFVVIVTVSRALGQELTQHVLQNILPKVTP